MLEEREIKRFNNFLIISAFKTFLIILSYSGERIIIFTIA
jgi:hypothetical protein